MTEADRLNHMAALDREIARQWALAGQLQHPRDAAYHASQARALAALRTRLEQRRLTHVVEA